MILLISHLLIDLKKNNKLVLYKPLIKILKILRLFYVYMIINFKFYKINRVTRKLIRIPMLITTNLIAKITEKSPHYHYSILNSVI